MELYVKIKEELTRIIPRKDCCFRAELSAIVKADGAISISERKMLLNISHNNASVVRKILMLLKRVNDPVTEVTMKNRANLKKGKIYTIKLSDGDQVRELLISLGILNNDSEFERGVPEEFFTRKCCRRAYIRGVFLGGGYFGKLEHGYHMEIAVSDLDYANSLICLLDTFGIEAKFSNRKDRCIVYIKSSDSLVEIMNVMEASNSALEFENMRILRSIRNDVNRLVNADSANAQKSVEASIKQKDDIDIVLRYHPLSLLPGSLAEIIRLRLENPEATLSELGMMTSPPIGKSGVNHRMRRISKLAQAHFEEENKPEVSNSDNESLEK